MTIGELLAKLWERIWDFWPFRIVTEWEQGVRVHAGKIVAELKHDNGPIPGARGLHWFIPLLGEIMVESCNWETGQSWLQTLESKDRATVSVQFSVTFRVWNLRMYYQSIHDHEQTLYGAVRSAAGEVIPTLEWSELTDKLPELMMASMKKRIRGWGLEVSEVVPVVLVRSKALRLVQ